MIKINILNPVQKNRKTFKMLILSPRANTADLFFSGPLAVEKRPVLLVVSTPIKSLDVAISNCNFSNA